MKIKNLIANTLCVTKSEPEFPVKGSGTIPRNFSKLKVKVLIEALLVEHKCGHVTPRSRGYGDVTATYIRRSELPSRIYAKHQYRQESEYGSKWCIIHSSTYIQLQSYHQKWSNITIILYHWCANARVQKVYIYEQREYKERYKYKQYKSYSRV